MSICRCLDGNITLTSEQVGKLQKVSFFKEVAQLEPGDDLYIDAKTSIYQSIIDFICQETTPYITIDNYQELLNYTKLYGLTNLITLLLKF